MVSFPRDDFPNQLGKQTRILITKSMVQFLAGGVELMMAATPQCPPLTGQRPETHPTGLGDYTHTLLPSICRTIYTFANGVHPALWILDQEVSFSAN